MSVRLALTVRVNRNLTEYQSSANASWLAKAVTERRTAASDANRQRTPKEAHCNDVTKCLSHDKIS